MREICHPRCLLESSLSFATPKLPWAVFFLSFFLFFFPTIILRSIGHHHCRVCDRYSYVARARSQGRGHKGPGNPERSFSPVSNTFGCRYVHVGMPSIISPSIHPPKTWNEHAPAIHDDALLHLPAIYIFTSPCCPSRCGEASATYLFPQGSPSPSPRLGSRPVRRLDSPRQLKQKTEDHNYFLRQPNPDQALLTPMHGFTRGRVIFLVGASHESITKSKCSSAYTYVCTPGGKNQVYLSTTHDVD